MFFYSIGMGDKTLAEFNETHPFECVLNEDQLKMKVSDLCIHGIFV